MSHGGGWNRELAQLYPVHASHLLKDADELALKNGVSELQVGKVQIAAGIVWPERGLCRGFYRGLPESGEQVQSGAKYEVHRMVADNAQRNIGITLQIEKLAQGFSQLVQGLATGGGDRQDDATPPAEVAPARPRLAHPVIAESQSFVVVE